MQATVRLGRQNGAVVRENSAPDSSGSHPASWLCGPRSSESRSEAVSQACGEDGGVAVCQTLMVPHGVTAAIPVSYWQPLIGAERGQDGCPQCWMGSREDRVQMWGERWAQWFGA